jgi:uncharacterized membrane protein YqjE
MDDQPISAILKDLLQGIYDLLQSEIKLAKVEMKRNTRDAIRQIQAIALFGAIAWLGAQVLFAFAVVGLGELLKNYWLSALILGAALFVPGTLLTLRALKKMKMDTGLPTSRSSLENDFRLTAQKVHDIAEATRRRAS